MTSPDILGLTGTQAAVHHQALIVAAAAIRDQMKLKAAQQFLPALKGQLAQYEAEATRMVEHFPQLEVRP